MIAPPDEYITRLLDQSLAEDLGGTGDLTSCAIFSEEETTTAVIKTKEAGVISGTYLLKPLFTKIDGSIEISICVEDGAHVPAQTVIARLHGSIRGILAGERTALNFLQRLSGIATSTATLSSLIAHTKTILLDTRKTTPTLRWLEKKAVLDGGGSNHRFGLYDMILIKDTHVRAAGGVDKAIQKARGFISQRTKVKIEAEVQSIDEFHLALHELPERIMLDNMSIEDMKQCVALVRNNHLSVELEASGNVSATSIASIAETGVNFISVGAITHSVKALDIHLVLL